MDWLNYLVLALYLAGLAAVAYFTRRRSRTINDFLLAGSGMSGLMTAFAYGTTYFSAVIFIGYAGQNGFAYGLASLWIGIGNAVIGSLLAWAVLAKRTRRLTHFTGARTMPELFEKRYGSAHIKLVSSLIIFVFLVPYAASVYQGLGYLFELVFHIPFWSVVVIMAAVCALYLFFGGYFATVVSDFLQGIIMLVGVVIMVGFVVNYETVGGLTEGFNRLLEDGLGFFPPVTKDGSAFGYNLLMLVLLTSVGVWGLPQIVHKFHTVRSEHAVRQAAWVSSGFALVIGVGAYLVGCLARYIIDAQSYVSAGEADRIIPHILVEAMPAGLLGLIAVLVLSASMSTLSSLTLASSSAVAVDLYKGYIGKDASDAKVNMLMRFLCLFFIAVSVLIAILQPAGIVELMSLSWGTLAGCFLAPYIYGLYWRRTTKAGAYAGIAAGLAVTAVLYLLSRVLPSAAASFLTAPAIGVFAMIAGAIAVPAVSAFTRPPEGTAALFDAMGRKEEENPRRNAPAVGNSADAAIISGESNNADSGTVSEESNNADSGTVSGAAEKA